MEDDKESEIKIYDGNKYKRKIEKRIAKKFYTPKYSFNQKERNNPPPKKKQTTPRKKQTKKKPVPLFFINSTEFFNFLKPFNKFFKFAVVEFLDLYHIYFFVLEGISCCSMFDSYQVPLICSFVRLNRSGVEERISNYYFVQELLWPLEFEFIYFAQWDWLMPFCPGHLPGAT